MLSVKVRCKYTFIFYLISTLPFFWNSCAKRLGRKHWEQAFEEPGLNFLQPGSGQRHFEAEKGRKIHSVYNLSELSMIIVEW